jgi:hypothetical protein
MLVIIGAAIAVAGCGGGDDSTSATDGASGASGAANTTPLSEEDFVSQANAICADGNSQVEALPTPGQDLAGLADYAQQVLDIGNPLLLQLDALVPPEDLADKYDEYISSSQDQAQLDSQLVEAAQAGDTQEVKSLVKQLNAANNDALANDLGLTECAKDVQPQG